MKHLPENLKNTPYYRNFVDSDELLPCPFCGSPAESQEVAVTVTEDPCILYNYGCTQCFSVRRFTKEEWNQRV